MFPKKAVSTIFGCILLAVAVFAKQLGIDNDDGWGTGRITLLAFGLIINLAVILSIYVPKKFAKINQIIFDEMYIIIATIIVGIVYFWVAQLNISSTQDNYNYYSELAKSFKSGQTYLAEKPSDALLALENPYDYNLRNEANVEDFPWDVTLYNQKFYLYWGPSPALLISAFTQAQLSQIGDRHLVAVFALGLFIYTALLVLLFYKRSLPNAPGWLMGLLVLVVGLTAPVTIMLQESTVYPIAVFGSQFFFIGGCFWIYLTISNNKLAVLNLIIAGIHWAFAIGTRITITPAILWSAGITIAYIYVTYKPSVKEVLISIAAIGIPLLLAVTGIGWYNWIRFGSLTETGFTYTLTGTNYTIFKKVFAVEYIGRNFYNYFFHPLHIRSQFPYLFRIEYIYTSERLGGLIFIAPFIIFALLPILSGIRKLQLTRYRFNYFKIKSNPELWLIYTFAGSTIISMMIILTFFWTEMRYLEDFMPSLLVFTVVGIGGKFRELNHDTNLRRIFLLCIAILGIITIILSTLVALKSGSLIFWTELGNTVLKILKIK